MTPTARSLELLRELGYTAQVVEKFNHHVGPHGIRIDLFGIADIEAIADDHTLYVQATPASNLAAHIDKLLEAPAMPKLLACPARRVEIWSWSKRGDRGKRKLWHVRRLRAVLDAAAGVSFVELAPPPRMPETAMGREAAR